MFAALRTIHELRDAPPLGPSSSPPSLSPPPPPSAAELQRAVFAAVSSSEHHLTRLHEEMQQKNGGGGGAAKSEDSKERERRLTDFITHTVQDHLWAVTCEAALATQTRKQQGENREDHREGPAEMDHSVLMRSDEDVAQLLWMNRTMALAATTSALEGGNVCLSELCDTKAPPQKKGALSVQGTIKHLRKSFPALRLVLIEREAHSTRGADETQVTTHHRSWRETGAKRPRTGDEENNEVQKPCLKKFHSSFSVKIDRNIARSQPDDRAVQGAAISFRENNGSGSSGSSSSNWQRPREDQVDQQQEQKQQFDASFRGGVSLQSVSKAKAQMTLNFESCGKLSLGQAPGEPISLPSSLFFSSPLATGNAVPQQQQQQQQQQQKRMAGARELRGGNRAAPTRRFEDETEEGHINTGGHSSGGFITAGEHLAADIKAGRTLPSNLSLQRRTPALGLRRAGFTPPFQQQRQQQQSSSRSDVPGGTSAAVPVTDVLSSIHKQTGKSSHESTREARRGHGTVGNPDDSDGERGEYPASLLLPDGSVPPILQPLNPKLVAQVAMEILEHGAGAASVGWDDIAGLEHAKRSVEEAIVWPLRRPDLFVGLRDPPRGLLLFGPPGTGKTMIARAIANRAQCTFLNISASSLMSKWMGDGEKLVRCLFAVAVVKQPSVIFIDEIDSLLSMRGEGEMDSVRRVKTEFLVQLDGVATDQGDRVLLIGATNRPEELDEAARRRMEKRLYIPLPDASARVELVRRLLDTLEAQLRQQRLEKGGEQRDAECVVHVLDEKGIAEIAAATEGYSGADIKQVCREAAMGPLREVTMRLKDVSLGELRPIQRRDFMQALKRIRPSVGASEVMRYTQWNDQFGSFSFQEEEAIKKNDESEEEIVEITQ